MNENKGLLSSYVHFILRYRAWVLLIVAVFTGFMFMQMLKAGADTDFDALKPAGHPFIQLGEQYHDMTASPNTLLCTLKVDDGDIYTVETIAKIDRITETITNMKGCDATTVKSLTNGNVRNTEISSFGTKTLPIVYPDLPKNQAELNILKNKVTTTPLIKGIYVSFDNKAATIMGDFEKDADPKELYAAFQQLKADEEDAGYSIHFAGAPAVGATFVHLMGQVVRAAVASFLLIFILMGFYFRTWQGVMIPFVSMLIALIGGLGLAGMAGYPVHILMIPVSIILSATALILSAFCLVRYYREYEACGNQLTAMHKAYARSFAPTLLAIMAVGTGMLAISGSGIPLLHKLGIFGSFWIISLFAGVLVFGPAMLAFTRAPASEKLRHAHSGGFCGVLGTYVFKPTSGTSEKLLGAAIVVVLIFGAVFSTSVMVGDNETGGALFSSDNDYIKGFSLFNQRFLGANALIVVVEGTEKDSLKNAQAMNLIDTVSTEIHKTTGARVVLSMPAFIKGVNASLHEGNPKWGMMPDDVQAVGGLGMLITSSSKSMKAWLDADWKTATIKAFYGDNDTDRINERIAGIRAVAQKYSTETISFKVVSGYLAEQAASNEVAANSYWVALGIAFAAILVLCALFFRCIKTAMIVFVPLALSQAIVWGFMYAKGMAISINAIPVGPVAAGISAAMGVYLVSQVYEAAATSKGYDDAWRTVFAGNAKVLVLMGLILTAVALPWAFIGLKFMAEMGLLISAGVFLNMVAALLFIPYLVNMFNSGATVEGKD